MKELILLILFIVLIILYSLIRDYEIWFAAVAMGSLISLHNKK